MQRRSLRRQRSDRPRRSQTPCLGEGFGVVRSGLVHGGEDEVGGAVDDAGNLVHAITREGLHQRTNHGNGSGHGGLEIQVGTGLLGRVGELSGVLGQQGLVGRDDGLALLQSRQHQLAWNVDAAEYLYDDVDVVAADQFCRVVGEQLGRYSTIAVDSPHSDASNRQWRTDSGLEVLGVLGEDADDLATDVSESEYGDAYRLRCHG